MRVLAIEWRRYFGAMLGEVSDDDARSTMAGR